MEDIMHQQVFSNISYHLETFHKTYELIVRLFVFVIDRNIIITVDLLHIYHFKKLQNCAKIMHVSFGRWNKVLPNIYILSFSSTI